METKTDITIRPAIPQDKEKLFHLVQQRGTFNDKEIEVAVEVIMDAIMHPAKEEYFILCAFDALNDLAGFICFGPIPMTDGCYDLYWIAVGEKFSRNGIGKKLLDSMEDFIAKGKARRIYIDTSSTPLYAAARTFYKKNGFHVISKLKDFYRPGDHKMIFMKEF